MSKIWGGIIAILGIVLFYLHLSGKIDFVKSFGWTTLGWTVIFIALMIVGVLIVAFTHKRRIYQ